jgi:hypothetical protein
MTATTGLHVGQIHALLAEKGYEVSEPGPDQLKIREVQSGITVQAVLSGNILYCSLVCTVVPKSAITPAIMERMLSAETPISTSYFQLYPAADGMVAVTLNNFCKLLDCGAEDEDDIVSCIHFLLADVVTARTVLSEINQ